MISRRGRNHMKLETWTAWKTCKGWNAFLNQKFFNWKCFICRHIIVVQYQSSAKSIETRRTYFWSYSKTRRIWLTVCQRSKNAVWIILLLLNKMKSILSWIFSCVLLSEKNNFYVLLLSWCFISGLFLNTDDSFPVLFSKEIRLNLDYLLTNPVIF